MSKYRESSYRPSNYRKSEYNKERKLRVEPKGWSIKEGRFTGGKIRDGEEERVEVVKEERAEVKTEVRPTETTDSYPGEDAVRELWGNNMPPPDLVNWVKKGSKEGDVWTRNKDSNTVVYNEKVGTFSISSDMPNQPIPDNDVAWEKP